MILQGDCLEKYTEIPNESVDLIITDLPYGTIKGAKAGSDFIENNEWDSVIEPKKIFEIAEKILRTNGKMILFSQEPFTTQLINSQTTNIPFLYKCIWKKNCFGNKLFCNKAPVSYFEEILVFGKKYGFESNKDLRHYFKSVYDYIGLPLKQINKTLGHRKAEHGFYYDTTQFALPTEDTYNTLVNTFHLQDMTNFLDYTTLQQMDKKPIFNLWEGTKYKSNIFEYAKDKKKYHPTQKPVLLLEDLIKTYSNENDLVVDLTMGSGSTGVACNNTNRRFIGIELNEEFYNIAKQRLLFFT